MEKKIFLLIAILTTALPVDAQQVLVCDGATKFPLRDVLVSADGHPVGSTNYLGLISMPADFVSATFKRKGFVPEKLSRQEVMSDTIFLYPGEHYLNEVVVTAKRMVNGKELLEKMPKRDILDKAPPHAMNEFDLALMLDKRFRRDKEHVEQTRKIFRKMDNPTNDPIIDAYLKTQQEKRDSVRNKDKEEEKK